MQKKHLRKSISGRFMVPVITAFLFHTLPVMAEEQKGIYLGLGVNYINFDNDRNLDESSDLYLVGGYQLDDFWSVEIESSEFDTNLLNPANIDFSSQLTTINAKYRLAPRGQNSAFWKIGYGRYDSTPLNKNQTTARIGVGLDLATTQNLSVLMGVDGLLSVGGGKRDLLAYIGASYFFGGTQKTKPVVVPKPQPKDSDGDGVIDSIDECPTTTPNQIVDERGCERDSDNDGVADSQDKCLETPAGAKVDETGCRVMLTKDVSISLNVQFANNSDAISETYHNEIGRVAAFMRQYPDTSAVIEGHTDSRGAASYNQQLSQKRANAVMQYLIEKFQIAASRLSAKGVGEASPIASNETAEGRATNRRVQAEIKTQVTSVQE